MLINNLDFIGIKVNPMTFIDEMGSLLAR